MADQIKSGSCCGGTGKLALVTEAETHVESGCCGGHSNKADTMLVEPVSTSSSACCGGSAREVAADAASSSKVEAERRAEKGKTGCGCGGK